ncbi:MAG: 16S rRNA (cytosine(967)-C(5))-methyltransferase RsmB [Suilimivivens sp.]
MENTRELAVNMLLEITEQNKYSHLVIRNVLDKYNYMDGRDKAFLKRITEGTLERKIQIDFVLNQFSKVSVSKMKPFIRNLLRVSVYQLLFMDNVPERAVCNEAVKLAGKRGFKNLQGFVNGVLRNIARKKEEISWPDEGKNTVGYLSVKYSMPEWLVEKFLSERGASQTEKMMESFLEASPVTVRLKETLKEEDREVFLNEMKKSGVRFKKHPYLPYAFEILNAEGISALPGFEKGLFMVQDVSSMLVCEAAGIKKGDRVIDVCASPGGKALHAAEKLQGTGFVSARDLTEYKAEMIRDNIRRMKTQNVEAFVSDARQLREEDVETADVLLCDLPCSGLGIIGKKTDIKYHVSEEGLKQLKELQREILSVVWQYVKKGGVLIYSTCTVNPDENEENVKWFTENYPFQTESLSPFLPECLKEEGKTGMLQLLPGIHETDGFFLARLRREE